MTGGAVFHAADLVKQRRPTDDFAPGPGLGRDVRREVHDLARVLQQVVPVVVPELQPPDQTREPGVEVEDAEPEGRLGSGFLGERFELLAHLRNHLFDARRVDAAVLEKALDPDPCDLPPDRIERREEDRPRRVVDDDVDAGGHLERADVAPLAPDDASLHLV